MKINQTPWKTGALPAPEPNQVMIEKTTSGSHRIYGSFGANGWWCLHELKYRYMEGGIPENRSGSLNEWSIITYRPENTVEKLEEIKCPKCQGMNIENLDEEGVYYDGGEIEVSCCNCKHQFVLRSEVEIELSIGDECLEEE